MSSPEDEGQGGVVEAETEADLPTRETPPERKAPADPGNLDGTVTIGVRGRKLTVTGKALRAFLLVCNCILLIFALGILIGAGYNASAHVFALVDTWFTPALTIGAIILFLSLVGSLGTLAQNRCILWVYVVVMALLGFIDLVVSSYTLSRANDGVNFLTNAWDVAPPPLRSSLQETFVCCGLNSYMDYRAALPCPDGSGGANSTYTPPSASNVTGTPCLPELMDEFNRYSRGVPGVGIILCFMMWGIAFLTFQLIRAIASSIRETSVEVV